MTWSKRGALWIAVFLPMTAVFLLTAGQRDYQLSPDVIAAEMSAWNVAEHGQLAFEAEPPITHNPWVVPSRLGEVTNRQPGVIAAGIPFYLLARPFTSGFELWPGSLAAACFAAAAAATLALLLLELGASRRQAVWFSVLGAAATATWPVSADALWTHGPDQLLLLAGLLAAARGRWRWCGVMLAMVVTVRTHLAVVPAVLGLWAGLRARSWRPTVVVGTLSATGLLAVLLYTHVVFGGWSLNAGYSAFGGSPSQSLRASGLSTTAHTLLEMLFTPDRGLFTTAPIVAVLLACALPRARHIPWWSAAAAVGGVLYLVVQARINGSSGGVHFWGSRLTIEPLTLLAPLLYEGWRYAAERPEIRRIVLAVTAISVSWQSLGALLFTPDSPYPTWRHWYIDDFFRFGPHIVAARVIILAGIATALVLLLRGGPETRPPTVPPGHNARPQTSSRPAAQLARP